MRKTAGFSHRGHFAVCDQLSLDPADGGNFPADWRNRLNLWRQWNMQRTHGRVYFPPTNTKLTINIWQNTWTGRDWRVIMQNKELSPSTSVLSGFFKAFLFKLTLFFHLQCVLFVHFTVYILFLCVSVFHLFALIYFYLTLKLKCRFFSI